MSHVANWKEIEITKDLTIPKLWMQSAKKYWDKKVAMREKEFGIWVPITWQEYYENVKRIALGMVSLGLGKEDKVAMIGDNRPEALWAEMAAISVQRASGRLSPIMATLSSLSKPKETIPKAICFTFS